MDGYIVMLKNICDRSYAFDWLATASMTVVSIYCGSSQIQLLTNVGIAAITHIGTSIAQRYNWVDAKQKEIIDQFANAIPLTGIGMISNSMAIKGFFSFASNPVVQNALCKGFAIASIHASIKCVDKIINFAFSKKVYQSDTAPFVGKQFVSQSVRSALQAIGVGVFNAGGIAPLIRCAMTGGFVTGGEKSKVEGVLEYVNGAVFATLGSALPNFPTYVRASEFISRLYLFPLVNGAFLPYNELKQVDSKMTEALNRVYNVIAAYPEYAQDKYRTYIRPYAGYIDLIVPVAFTAMKFYTMGAVTAMAFASPLATAFIGSASTHYLYENGYISEINKDRINVIFDTIIVVASFVHYAPGDSFHKALNALSPALSLIMLKSKVLDFAMNARPPANDNLNATKLIFSHIPAAVFKYTYTGASCASIALVGGAAYVMQSTISALFSVLIGEGNFFGSKKEFNKKMASNISNELSQDQELMRYAPAVRGKIETLVNDIDDEFYNDMNPQPSVEHKARIDAIIGRHMRPSSKAKFYATGCGARFICGAINNLMYNAVPAMKFFDNAFISELPLPIVAESIDTALATVYAPSLSKFVDKIYSTIFTRVPVEQAI